MLTVYKGVGLGKRVDRTLADHLIMGKGARDTDGPAVFVEQHARSYLAMVRHNSSVPRAMKEPGKMNVNAFREHQLMRYLWVARQFFKDCKLFCLAIDGTRVGKNEYNLLVISGTNEKGETLSAWCPPQVLWEQATRISDSSLRPIWTDK